MSIRLSQRNERNDRNINCFNNFWEENVKKEKKHLIMYVDCINLGQ